MKRIFLLSTLLSAVVFGNAQSAKTFAITGEGKGNYNWIQVKQVNISNGTIEKDIFNPKDGKEVSYSAVNKQKVSVSGNDHSTATMVAAAAYDEKNNRLYFTTMRGNSLKYFDFNNGDHNIVINNDPAFNTGNKYTGEANIITRMAFASDGKGYALTNDGNSLISFTTDEKPVIKNLGSLIDGKKNGQVSVHTQCTSWGGDLVGDVFGNLYLFSFKNYVFKINPKTLVADYIGIVKGLPANFTINGAAVEEKGNVIVSSSTLTENYYRVNVSTLDATPIAKAEETVYNASDLANGNLLFAEAKVKPQVAPEVKGNDAISIYPNPAVNKNFQISFENVANGTYTIELSDASGRKVVNQKTTIGKFQTEKVKLPSSTTPGIYLVKVIDAKGKAVYNDKIVVE